MTRGNNHIVFIFCWIILTTNWSFGENKILSAPLTNLDQLQPSFENIEDTKSFKRNHKPRDLLITSEEDGFSIEYELENQNNSSQWIDMNTTSSVITIEILSAYPGEEVNGAEPFSECVIQEITFYGRG